MEKWYHEEHKAPCITVIKQKTNRTEINRTEWHNQQRNKTGNVMEEYSHFNRVYDYCGKQPYRKRIWDHLKTGIKFDKAKLGGDDFHVARLCKSGSRKTTVMESMIIAPNFRVHPDDLEEFLNEIGYRYFDETMDYLLGAPRMEGVIPLKAYVHVNEVYVPESITVNLPDGTQKEVLLDEEERWKHAYIKPHLHFDYIPTVLEKDAKGISYRKLSRGDIWKSKSGKYYESYTEFLDDKYESLDKKYGFERGVVHTDLPEDERPIVNMSLQEWQHVNDQARIDRLINQQKDANELAIAELKHEAELIEEMQDSINEAKADMQNDLNEYVEKVVQTGNYAGMTRADYMEKKILEHDNAILFGLLNVIETIIKPIQYVHMEIYEKITGAIRKARMKLQLNREIQQQLNENFDK